MGGGRRRLRRYAGDRSEAEPRTARPPEGAGAPGFGVKGSETRGAASWGRSRRPPGDSPDKKNDCLGASALHGAGGDSFDEVAGEEEVEDHYGDAGH